MRCLEDEGGGNPKWETRNPNSESDPNVQRPSGCRATTRRGFFERLIRLSDSDSTFPLQVFHHPIHRDRQLQIIFVSPGPNGAPEPSDLSSANVAAGAEQSHQLAKQNPPRLAAALGGCIGGV